MKLYTEEQLIKAMETALIPPIYRQDLWGHLTPIELPSDEEIEQQASGVYSDPIRWAPGEKYVRSSIYTDGAKWVIEQIKKQVIP